MSWHHGDYLSLAQAIAAMLAVFGAFGVVFVQRHFEAMKQAEADRRSDIQTKREMQDVIRVARLVVETLVLTLDEAREAVGKQHFSAVSSHTLEQRIDEHIAQIRQIPLYGLPTHAAMALLGIDLACTNIRRVVVERARVSGVINGYGSYIHAIDEQIASIKNRTIKLVIDSNE
ncbi:hypothetical protein [Paraburkholderia dioscoreae]|uniref:hypothetical protein n=1 Tax=Paraburkholderia dioscoreae TaxID=2604047 RepID=UPI0013ECBF93|nr:hypothetical protein [Paraburkholderia dioscoreae]